MKFYYWYILILTLKIAKYNKTWETVHHRIIVLTNKTISILIKKH
ncbi:MAG: hypothetical protein ACD_3C00150G0001 [uncultured bacterium (gcode 4)]|uniref:Uncharacterized protein n=1 Tax=uncultured bacterium (gcode 4) TaxID=1234023 RepID=K2G0T9_9BACT|nr:MAG: hypothetical protein ACD_3C00150G0001 [uncultured bacterium (gcode 4)]